jgi:spoIIIJ-associated protein
MMSEQVDLRTRVAAWVDRVVDAMGLELTVSTEEHDDHLRIVLEGDDGEWLVRRKGEGLDALQHVVNSAFRREVDRGKRLVVDALDFRKAKDRELKQMARFLIDKVRSTGVPQEIGPLNSYSRRLVHLEVSNEPDMASESIGDGTTKVIVISRKPASRP